MPRRLPIRHHRLCVVASPARAGSERRRHPRLGGGPPLTIRGLHAAVEDVSRSGLRLLVAMSLREGERYQITLVDGLDGSSRSLEAEVIWYRPGHAGLRWVTLEVELDRWLEQRFRAWVSAAAGLRA